ISATTILLQSPSAVNPAFATEPEDSHKPMTIIIGPITTGGSNQSIQELPINLTNMAMNKNEIPDNIIPV
ncbi:hypothetical protein CVR98_25265, partial [Salmonella enterica subsp. enterica serovar Enteritidis]